MPYGPQKILSIQRDGSSSLCNSVFIENLSLSLSVCEPATCTLLFFLAALLLDLAFSYLSGSCYDRSISNVRRQERTAAKPTHTDSGWFQGIVAQWVAQVSCIITCFFKEFGFEPALLVPASAHLTRWITFAASLAIQGPSSLLISRRNSVYRAVQHHSWIQHQRWDSVDSV